MKTLKNFSIKRGSALSLVLSMFLLSSCEKEDIANLDSAKIASAKNELRAAENRDSKIQSGKATADQLSRVRVFTMIKIDHMAARTYGPDYCVSVKSDGTIIFEGRRNVAFVGVKEWKLNAEKFIAVKFLFEHSDFYSIKDDISFLADIPMVSTSWSPSGADRAKTLVDYNQGYPEELISLRKKAEEVLDISGYINYIRPQAALSVAIN